VSSWTVSRRYSEFYELHRSLRRQFADVKNVGFPKKSNPLGAVLKPTRGGFVEGRMASLEKYIQVYPHQYFLILDVTSYFWSKGMF
jgi:PX domain